MRIAIDISQIVYGTGVSVYTENLVKTLVKTHPEVDWVLFAGVFRQKEIVEKFIRDLRVKGVVKIFPPRLADIIWNKLHVFPIENWLGKVDLIHTSDWAEPPSLIPKITTVHDLVPIKFPETTTAIVKNAHLKKLSWVKKESRKILAVSESTKKDLVETLNIKPEIITVTQEGVGEIYYPQKPEEINKIKKKYGINGNYLFSLSTLEPRKNQKRLIEAFEKVRVKYPELKLVLTGKVGWGNEIKPVKNVITTGYVPKEDLPALFSGSAAYILPSLYEGFSLSHLQAMACGAPVVGSNISSMPEVIGDAGILVNPKSVDDITRGIINAVEKRSHLKTKGLAQAKMFSWETTAEKTFNAYRSIF